jgi:hypothetical protein
MGVTYPARSVVRSETIRAMNPLELAGLVFVLLGILFGLTVGVGLGALLLVAGLTWRVGRK